MLYKDFAHMTA